MVPTYVMSAQRLECLLFAERDYVVNEDFMKAVRKVAEAKRLESKLEYQKL